MPRLEGCKKLDERMLDARKKCLLVHTVGLLHCHRVALPPPRRDTRAHTLAIATTSPCGVSVKPLWLCLHATRLQQPTPQPQAVAPAPPLRGWQMINATTSCPSPGQLCHPLPQNPACSGSSNKTTRAHTAWCHVRPREGCAAAFRCCCLPATETWLFGGPATHPAFISGGAAVSPPAAAPGSQMPSSPPPLPRQGAPGGEQEEAA
jgi:hypothetical protein